eukprot:TRINITY_DN8332_c0_g1_i1.p1 TRINITY_DN8332_c0_g1~~TRINITY_DN8332_c0_g1_i1.p1  ORF type:complete len:200 (-),score=39.19 TRINITY_DN8332_c0_g1_i1:53-652(-)
MQGTRELEMIFPNLDKNVLILALDAAGNDVEQAMDALFRYGERLESVGKLKVRISYNKPVELFEVQDKTFGDIKQQILTKFPQYKAQGSVLMKGEVPVNDSAQVSTAGVEGQTLTFDGPQEGEYQIESKSLTQQIRSHWVKGSITVEELKARIEHISGIPIDQQRIIYAGVQLEDERTIGDYNILEGATVHLVLRLRGD